MKLARQTASAALAAMALAGTVTGGAAVAAPPVTSATSLCGAATVATGSLSTGSLGSASLGDPAYLCAKPGDLLDVRIGDVHATQPSLGHDEVYYKLGRYTLGKDAINKKFDD